MDIVTLAAMVNGGGSPGGAGPVRVAVAQRAALGMPALNTANITDSNGNTNTLANTTTVFDYPGIPSKMRIVFGRVNPLNPNTLVYPTLPMTDDGSTGSGFLKLVTFPKGIITINGCFPNLPVVISAATAWTCTTSVMSIGSAAAATDATLTSTEADIVGSTTLKLLTYSSNVAVIGSVISGSLTTLASRTGIFTANDPPIIASVLDNSGGTSQATMATISTNTPGNINNVFTTLNTQLNTIAAQVAGLRGVRFDGTTTALSLYLNFGVNSDPAAAQTISLGQLTAGSEFAQPPGYIDIYYTNRMGGSSTALFDVPPPLHGAGGG